MKRKRSLGGLFAALLISACNVTQMDPGPTQTSHETVELGKAETVRAEIKMGAGELRLDSGGDKLLAASFRYSESLGQPSVSYTAGGTEGRLTIHPAQDTTSIGKSVNEWELHMGTSSPLDAVVHMGAGKASLDFSKASLRSLEVHMGAGELDLNLAGSYTKDVSAQVSSGVGEARIRLPKNFGVIVEAKAGVGGVNAKGLSKRDGRYYNDAYAEGKPALHLDVKGGVGEVTLEN